VAVGDRMVAGGDALAHQPDGRVLFVSGALPGERVRAEVTERSRDWARAVTTEVIVASPERVHPPCPSAARGCGGCQWQHVATTVQATLKAAVVVDALRRLGRREEPDVVVGAAVPPDRYRTTVRLDVDADGRPSYHRRGDRTLVAPDHGCGVAHPRLAELIVDGRFPGATRVGLRVGVAGGERLALPTGGIDRRSVRVPAGTVVVDPDGRASVHEQVAGRSWRISARSFFQSGPAAAGPLDGGVGLLGGSLVARHGGSLWSVDADPDACGDAETNLADLAARVVRAEVGSWRPPHAGPAAALVVADPARPGLGRPGVAAVAAIDAPVVVLVSCDPASLGRDVALLAATGYELGRVEVLDLFPHTVHVETVARFERR